MAVPAHRHRFLTTIAELAQDIMNHDVQVVVCSDGSQEYFRPGLSGKILDKLYDARLDDLELALSATPFGGAILAFLDAQETMIDFSHRMDSHGMASALNEIHLRSGCTNDELLGVLVHEARHIWQIKGMAGGYASAVPPDVAIGRDILMEADAFSFQHKFLEDYADKTGHRKPLQVFLDGRKVEQEFCGLRDEERFVYWAEKVRHAPAYMEQMLSQAERGYAAMKAHGADRYPSRAIAPKMLDDLGQTLCRCWPFTAPEGESGVYLDKIPAERVQALRAPVPAIQGQVDFYNAAYDRLQVAGAAPPVTAASASFRT